MKFEIFEEKRDTAVSFPEIEGLWKVSEKSKLWFQILSKENKNKKRKKEKKKKKLGDFSSSRQEG